MWNNQFLRTETKTQDLQVVPPVLVYVVKIGPEITETQEIEITGTRELKMMVNRTRKAQVKNLDIKKCCKIQPVMTGSMYEVSER